MLHHYSGVDRFQQQFAHLEENYRRGVASSPLRRQPTSLPRHIHEPIEILLIVRLNNCRVKVILDFLFYWLMWFCNCDRERVCSSEDGHNQDSDNEELRAASYVARTTISPPRSQEESHKLQSAYHTATNTANSCAKSYLKTAANISDSRRGIKRNKVRKVLCTTKYYTSTQISFAVLGRLLFLFTRKIDCFPFLHSRRRTLRGCERGGTDSCTFRQGS